MATSSGQVQARHPRQTLDLARYGACLGAFAALLDAAGSRRSRLSTTRCPMTSGCGFGRRSRMNPCLTLLKGFGLSPLACPGRSGAVGLLVWGSRPNLRLRRTSLTNDGPLSTCCWSPPQENGLGHLQSSSCLLRSSLLGYGQKGMRRLPCNCGESFCRKRARRVSESQPVPSITLDFGRCVLGEVALREGR